jgi:hypothetical protein
MAKYLNHVDFGQNEIRNAVVQNLSEAPSNPVDGQIYFDTDMGALLYWVVDHWVFLEAAEGAYVELIGDGSDISIVITHNLGTTAVDVSLYENTGNRTRVETDVEITSANTVTLNFSEPPATDSYYVVVFAQASSITGGGGGGGTNGIDGADGASAYEVAVSNGFVGNELDWLDSLVGPQGPKGNTGATGSQGPQGVQGIQGPQGETGVAGMQYLGPWDDATDYDPNDAVSYGGSVYITDGTGTVGDAPTDDDGATTNPGWFLFAAEGAQGPQGVQGIQGIQGVPGTDGAYGAD